MYFGMLFIGWNLHQTMQRWSLDVGWISTWVKIVNEWLAAGLFIWTLVAPVVWKKITNSVSTSNSTSNTPVWLADIQFIGYGLRCILKVYIYFFNIYYFLVPYEALLSLSSNREHLSPAFKDNLFVYTQGLKNRRSPCVNLVTLKTAVVANVNMQLIMTLLGYSLVP